MFGVFVVVVVLLILSEGWARDLTLKIEIKAQDEMVTPPRNWWFWLSQA